MAKRKKDWAAEVQALTGSGRWLVGFVEAALHDLDELSRSGQIEVVLGALLKLARNPRPKAEGGYGEPLGHKQRTGNLTGLLSVKLKGRYGLRLVYQLVQEQVSGRPADAIKVLVVRDREEERLYREAVRRLAKDREK